MLDAVWGPGPGFKPTLGDRGAAHGADPVGALFHPGKGGIDLRQGSPALFQERGCLGELEGDRAALGVVFIVNIGVKAGGIDRGDVFAEDGEEGKLPATFLVQQGPEPFDVNHRVQG